jgi:sugar phosphate permease
MLKSLKQRYHWLIALLVFLEMIVFGGLINSASVFIVPICAELGVNRADYALATVPYTFVCFLSTMMSGFFFRRFGYRRSALVSLGLVAFSLAVTASSDNLFMFAVSKVLFATGYGVCFTAGSVRIVKQWFHKHQGLVLGAVSMSTGLGGSLMTVFLSALIDRYGWRIANYGAAALVVLIGILYLLIRDTPEDLGLKPFGEGAVIASKKSNSRLDGSDCCACGHVFVSCFEFFPGARRGSAPRP